MLQGDPEDTLEGQLDDDSFARFLAKIKDGELWYESAFVDRRTGHSVLARDALLQNYSDWHAIVMQLHNE
jgi:hypothetical protein